MKRTRIQNTALWSVGLAVGATILAAIQAGPPFIPADLGLWGYLAGAALPGLVAGACVGWFSWREGDS
jgi:hypothetical protein